MILSCIPVNLKLLPPRKFHYSSVTYSKKFLYLYLSLLQTKSSPLVSLPISLESVSQLDKEEGGSSAVDTPTTETKDNSHMLSQVFFEMNISCGMPIELYVCICAF